MGIRRFIAFFIDILIWFFIFFYPFIWFMDFLISSSVLSLLIVHGLLLVLMSVSAFYGEGRTWGQKLSSVELKTMDKQYPSFSRLLLHFFSAYLLYLYSFGALYIVSLIVQTIRTDDRMLHDLIAGIQPKFSVQTERSSLQSFEER